MEQGDHHDVAEGEASHAPAIADILGGDVQREQEVHEPDRYERVLQVVAQVMDREAARGDNRSTVHERFMKLSPPTFSGTTDLLFAESWLKSMENIFEVMRVPDEQKVVLATFMLKGEARFWWDATKMLLTMVGGVVPRVPTVIGWDKFVEVFNNKYFLMEYQLEKEREFIWLTQGDMNVMQYEAKFTELSRFAHDFVQTKAT